jgi:hypothetical protein
MARPAVVVEDGDPTCAHDGTRSLSAGPVKLTVAASPVIPLAVVAGAAQYSGCKFKDPNGNSHPCLSTAVTSTGAAKLTVGGKPVLLDSDTVTTANDLATIFTATIHPGQSKLTAS